MGALRRPFQGVLNILRFNWHVYVLALGIVTILAAASLRLEGPLRLVVVTTVVAIAAMTLTSLLVSCYVYDFSGLYRLDWLDAIPRHPGARMLNIHAGFDETSPILRARYPEAEWTVMDFYDPVKHTEVSIRRARKAYAPAAEDIRVSTHKLPVSPGSIDVAFVLFAAHEIRDEGERCAFFSELGRVLKPQGKAVVLEHLRDGPNALAYTVGVFHFVGEKAWLASFAQARLRVVRRIKPNPLLTCFILEANGNAS